MKINQLEKILKALANRRRLAILAYLKRKGEAPVGEIAGEIRLSFKATSKHLRILATLDIIERDQHGLEVYYRISPDQTIAAQHVLELL